MQNSEKLITFAFIMLILSSFTFLSVTLYDLVNTHKAAVECSKEPNAIFSKKQNDWVCVYAN